MNTPWKEKLQFVILSSPSSSLHFLFILDNHMFKRRRKTWEGHTLYFFSTQIGDLCRFQKQFTLSLYQNRNVWHFYTFTQLSLFCDHKRNQNMAYIWQLGMRRVKKIDSRIEDWLTSNKVMRVHRPLKIAAQWTKKFPKLVLLRNIPACVWREKLFIRKCSQMQLNSHGQDSFLTLFSK